MNGGQLPTNQLHDINWGALDHAPHAPQLLSCSVCMCVCVCVCNMYPVHVLPVDSLLSDWHHIQVVIIFLLSLQYTSRKSTLIGTTVDFWMGCGDSQGEII